MLVIRRIHVTYRLKGVAKEDRQTVDRVHGFHADHCPVAVSIRASIDITTEVEYID
ncbi:MAG: OsmC family protein [Acidimicrobiia bacterium]|nr:OsmC family protein [Acidimicrobiia bacterium]MDH3398029.1 OsmC family protein [Acidimicrobiia bacterium]